MKEFTTADYQIYAGAEAFSDGSEPLIHTTKAGLDIIADLTGVSLYGTIGTADFGFWLYQSRGNHSRKAMESIATAWIEDLEDLKKHEVVALLNGIGLKNMHI